MSDNKAHVLKFLLLVLSGACIYISSIAQVPLTYQVLAVENARIGNQRLYSLERVAPGDTIHIEDSGYLALISNYYHAIEITSDSVLVLSALNKEDLDRFHTLPDLRNLFGDKPFGKYGAVEHVIPNLEWLYPGIVTLIGRDDSQQIRLIWRDTRWGDLKKEKLIVQFRTIFEDEIMQIVLESDSLCLRLSEYPEVVSQLQENGNVMVDIRSESERTNSILLKRSKTPDFRLPDTCEITDPVVAVMTGLSMEYEHAVYSEYIEPFFKLATQISARPVYQTIYQYYLNRKK